MSSAGEMYARVVGWIQNVECAIAFVIILAVGGGAIFGVTPYYVQSGSMEPAMHVGSLALVKKGVDPSSLEEGDIVAFGIVGGETVTHRVVENDRVARELTTKGDANEAADPSPVDYGSVVGRCLVSIPLVGYAAQAVESAGVVFVAIVVAVNLALWATARAAVSLPRRGAAAERI